MDAGLTIFGCVLDRKQWSASGALEIKLSENVDPLCFRPLTEVGGCPPFVSTLYKLSASFPSTLFNWTQSILSLLLGAGKVPTLAAMTNASVFPRSESEVKSHFGELAGPPAVGLGLG